MGTSQILIKITITADVPPCTSVLTIKSWLDIYLTSHPSFDDRCRVYILTVNRPESTLVNIQFPPISRLVYSCNIVVQTYYLSALSRLTARVVHVNSYHVVVAALALGLDAASGCFWGSLRDSVDALWPILLVVNGAQAAVW